MLDLMTQSDQVAFGEILKRYKENRPMPYIVCAIPAGSTVVKVEVAGKSMTNTGNVTLSVRMDDPNGPITVLRPNMVLHDAFNYLFVTPDSGTAGEITAWKSARGGREPSDVTGSAVGLQNKYVDENGISWTIQRKYVDVPTNATTDIVAATSGKITRVLSYTEQCGATNQSLYWKSATLGQISATHANAANGGRVCGENRAGHFQTATNEKLQIVAAAGGSTTGVELTYVVMTP